MNEEQWLATRTFHHSQFDPEDLAVLKREQGLTISLCLPTLNEEKTIGKVVRVLKSTLVDRYGLVDEIGVVDSGSRDRTEERARKAGADFFLASEHIPEMGQVKGKGENLWKSLYLFSGDIIVWVDADIKNIHPRFVYGLIGPLLKDPEIGYVKAFYKRPIKVGSRVRPGGGGRVTELLVRPYLSLLFPELSLLAQPLSGEYAGRRKLLERVPFLSGYGVEVGLLIDLTRSFGIDSIAQVDMDVRIHRNQDIDSLRRMSYAILSVLITRSAQLGKFAILESLGRELQTIKREGEHYVPSIEEVSGKERPAMISVSAYQKKRNIDEEEAAFFHDLRPLPMHGAGLSAMLQKQYVKLDLSHQNRDQAIQELVALLKERKVLEEVDELSAKLLLRERTHGSNIGHGIAIPHVVCPGLQDTILLVGRSPKGINFDSRIIPRPVHLIFMILIAEREKGGYLDLLSLLARLLKNRKMVQALLEAQTEAEFISLFSRYETLARLQAELA